MIKKSFLYISLGIFLFSIFSPVLAGEYQNVTGDSTLTSNTTVTGPKWIKSGRLTVGAGVTLQINPNSTLTFEPGYGIINNKGGATILISKSAGKIVKAVLVLNCHGYNYGGNCWFIGAGIPDRTALSCQDVCDRYEGGGTPVALWDYSDCRICKYFRPGAGCSYGETPEKTFPAYGMPWNLCYYMDTYYPYDPNARSNNWNGWERVCACSNSNCIPKTCYLDDDNDGYGDDASDPKQLCTATGSCPAGFAALPATGCGGHKYLGNCWYKATTAGQTCSSVCLTHGGCVQAQWNDTTDCAVCRHFTGSFSCYIMDGSGLPFIADGICWYRSTSVTYGNQDCAAVPNPSTAYRLCVCAN